VFSSQTSEEQGRTFGRGRGTVDCCYPVKCMSGHYGELVFGQKRKIDIMFSPMIRSLPSCLAGHVVDSLSCPRVMAAPENIKAGFTRERDVFAQEQIDYISPLVCLAEPRLVPKQLHQSLAGAIPGLTYDETAKAVAAGYAALEQFNRMARGASSEVLAQCAKSSRPCILILARPYHLDTGIGHEIEIDLQAYGYPILWAQYLPTDASLLDWLFGDDLRSGAIASPFDISDVWPSSYSGNTNEILWGAKVGARLPWVTCVIRLTSYECGMDQPTFTPVQQIVEGSGTLFFLPRSRLHEAGRLREDPRRDHRALSGMPLASHHSREAGAAISCVPADGRGHGKLSGDPSCRDQLAILLRRLGLERIKRLERLARRHLIGMKRRERGNDGVRRSARR